MNNPKHTHEPSYFECHFRINFSEVLAILASWFRNER